jgi:hypothetical protein
MPITSAFTNQAKLDCIGVNQSSDTYKIALYTSAATLDKTTTAYTATNEVANGNGYTTGGATLSGYARALSGDVAYLDWNDPSWANATITARGALIYNVTRSNASITVIDFGQDYTATAGTFTVTLPAPGATAIVRIT